MATWHQQRAGAPAGIRHHPTQWSVVSDPPNLCCTVSLVSSRFQAQQLKEGLEFHHPRLRGYVFILPPEASE